MFTMRHSPERFLLVVSCIALPLGAFAVVESTGRDWTIEDSIGLRYFSQSTGDFPIRGRCLNYRMNL